MQYIFVDKSGKEISLVISSDSDEATFFVESDEVFIHADDVLDDLANEISATGSSAYSCYETITDGYRNLGDNVTIESFNNHHYKEILEYLEELRIEDVDDEYSNFYNEGREWTIEDLGF